MREQESERQSRPVEATVGRPPCPIAELKEAIMDVAPELEALPGFALLFQPSCLEVSGTLYEMGNVEWPTQEPGTVPGIVVQREDGGLVHVIGLTQAEVRAMPSLLFRGARLSLTPNAGHKPPPQKAP